MEDDSVKLLRECNAGIKMGISSIDDVMNHVHKTMACAVSSKTAMTFTAVSATTPTKC